jgi:hypothetical protein
LILLKNNSLLVKIIMVSCQTKKEFIRPTPNGPSDSMGSPVLDHAESAEIKIESKE